VPAASPVVAPALPLWRAQALQDALAAIRPGIEVEVRAQVESTNSALVERARGGDASACLLVAEHQTGGRGRLGRSWQSSPGASLTFSLALPLAPPDWSGLSLAVGLALADALDPPRPGTAPRLGLKWPNDLQVVDPRGDRKAGGILIETVAAGTARVAVTGVGLNLAPQPVDAPSTGYGWLGEIDPGLDPPTALARVAPALLRALLAFERDGFAPLRARYAARDRLAGRAVTTTLPGLAAGIAEGVDAQGVLWLLAAGQRHAVASGEVSVRAAAPGGAAPC
jgi:BirA family biotin operon repressor/biotin-[acetyl-CoA-carboxylase] ligase